MSTATPGRLIRALALAAVMAGVAVPTQAQERVEVPSLDRQPDGAAVMQPGFWLAVPGAGTAPAMVLLHGCGGTLDRAGDRLSARASSYARWLNAQGVHVLVTDSLTPRGETELCTQKTGTRAVTQVHRRRDALGALQWLAGRPGVDPARIGLLGWSHGGSAVLASTNLQLREVRASAVAPSLAVAFYPGCAADLKAGYRGSAPLLLLVGEADDWTPAGPCRELAASATGAAVSFEAYPGAYHGFDSTARVVLRQDVPNGVHPGQGVHVGGDAQALKASRDRLRAFLREHWKLP